MGVFLPSKVGTCAVKLWSKDIIFLDDKKLRIFQNCRLYTTQGKYSLFYADGIQIYYNLIRLEPLTALHESIA